MTYRPMPYCGAKGFSLIELLVSMLISLIVLAGVVQVVVNSKRAYLDNQDIAYVQDNARYVMDIMSREIRLAGYKGCATEGATVTSIVKKDLLPTVLGLAGDSGFLPMTGYEGVAAVPAITAFNGQTANTDSLMLWHGGITQDAAVLSDNPGSTQFSINTSSGFETGQAMMVIDAKCQNVGIFAATAVTAATAATPARDATADAPAEVARAATPASINYANSGNNCTSGSLKSTSNCGSAPAVGSKNFASGSRLIPYVAAGYYIGTSTISPGMTALKRLSVKPDGTAWTEEIAQGVSDMQIKYGEISGSGASATYIYRNASTVANWNNVVTVQIALTFRSIGTWKNADGSFMTKTLTSTIQIRNRI